MPFLVARPRQIGLAFHIYIISNMDKYCIIVIHNLFPEDRHVFTLVGPIFFCQQNFKEKVFFQA